LVKRRRGNFVKGPPLPRRPQISINPLIHPNRGASARLRPAAAWKFDDDTFAR
jgi:hypothetical protein